MITTERPVKPPGKCGGPGHISETRADSSGGTASTATNRRQNTASRPPTQDGIGCQIDDLLPLIFEAIDREIPLRLDVDEIDRNFAALQEVADQLRKAVS